MVFKFFKKSFSSISKSSSILGRKLRGLFQRKIDEDLLEELEEILYEADLGVSTATEIVDKIRENAKKNPKQSSEDLLAEIKTYLLEIIQTNIPNEEAIKIEEGPEIILIVGVNGSGKTTSVAKLAKHYHKQGKKVLLAAADTFRAAAVEQLDRWAKTLDIDIIKGVTEADPSSVVFDAVTAGKARGCDVVLVDTAGRLHTKQDLMQELQKIRRTCKKVIPSAPHKTLLVLDSTIGQNAIDQAKTFHKHTPMNGLILTKMDGTAKGGVVISIVRELGLPISYLGSGEGIDDLAPFDAESFIDGLLAGD